MSTRFAIPEFATRQARAAFPSRVHANAMRCPAQIHCVLLATTELERCQLAPSFGGGHLTMNRRPVLGDCNGSKSHTRRNRRATPAPATQMPRGDRARCSHAFPLACWFDLDQHLDCVSSLHWRQHEWQYGGTRKVSEAGGGWKVSCPAPGAAVAANLPHDFGMRTKGMQ